MLVDHRIPSVDKLDSGSAVEVQDPFAADDHERERVNVEAVLPLVATGPMRHAVDHGSLLDEVLSESLDDVLSDLTEGDGELGG